MTYYEYIKEIATPEQIAQIFDNLESDSGYYTDNNISAIACMIENPDEYVERCKNFWEDEEDWKIYSGYAYDKAIKFLNSEIKED